MIGAEGGRAGTGGGFASDEKDENGMTGGDRARMYGAMGGKKSRRKPGMDFNCGYCEGVGHTSRTCEIKKRDQYEAKEGNMRKEMEYEAGN